MKLNKIHAGIVLALAANGAYAYAPGTTHDIVVYVSGASAQDTNIENLVYNDFCVADTNRHKYSYNGAVSDYRAISCLTKSSGIGTVPTSKKLLVIKRSKGGSVYGVNPVLQNTAIDFMRVSSGCSTTGVATGYDYNCTLTETVVPHGGVADTNPELYIGSNLPSGWTDVTGTQLANAKVYGTVGQAFGVVVSLNLRNELQNQLVEAGKLPAVCNNADSAPGVYDDPDRETEACMPTFTKAEMASILSANMYDWNQLSIETFNGKTGIYDVAVAKGRAVPADNWTDASSGLETGNVMKICRREAGSGTQATASAKLLDSPCSPYGATVAGTTDSPAIFENASSGAMDTCMSNSGTAPWAIGFQSTEKNMDRSKNYRFVKLDGVAPLARNVWNGTYGFWGEGTIMWRNAVDATFQGQVLNQIKTDAASSTRIVARASAYDHSWGRAGYVALASNGNTPDNSFASMTTPYQHIVNGAMDNCRIPTFQSTGATIGTVEPAQ